MILDLIWYTYCPLLSTEYKYWMEQLHRVENFQETNIGTYLQERILRYWGQNKICLKLGGDNIK